MKKEIRQFSKYAAWFSVHILVIGLLLPAYAVAQRKTIIVKPAPKPKVIIVKPAATPKIYWYVDYTVTVKGNGIRTNPKKDKDPTIISKDPIIIWSIDRTYSGVMKLTSSYAAPTMAVMDMEGKELTQEIQQVIRSGRFTRFSTPLNVAVPTRVKIYDVLNVSRIRKDDPYNCRGNIETTTELKTWEADGTFDAIANAMLNTDSKSRTYNVWIPIVFIDSSMTMLSKTEIDRSNFCPDRKLPAHEETPVEETQVRIALFSLPNIEGLITDKAVVEHKPDKPFPPNFLTAWEYDSGDMTPDEPLIDDVPDSKTNVKVRVHYRFSKTPIY